FGPSQPTPYQVISEGKPIGPPPDREDIHGAERRIATASASGNCNRIADLYGINSASGSTPEACQLITQIGATTPTGIAEYGNEAGVIDYATPGRGATLVMVRQADGRFHIVYTAAHDPAPSAGTPLAKGADNVEARAAESLRTLDCDKFLELAFQGAGIGYLPQRRGSFAL